MNAPKHTTDIPDHRRQRVSPSPNQSIWRGPSKRGPSISSRTIAPLFACTVAPQESNVSLNEILLQDRDRLLRSNLELEHFATLAAHDLKSPLHAAFSWLNILSQQLQPNKFAAVDQSIEIIQRNLNNAISYVNELLQISKAEDQLIKREVCVISQLVSDVLSVHADALKKANASIHQEELPQVTASPKQLECVFSNLIGNAVKYKHPDRNLTITIGAIERCTVVEYFIKDNGIGIPTSKLEDIFTLFESIAHRAVDRGTGIGLAFCRKIIALHGGRIWAESTEGHGSTIRFQLPK